MYKVLLTDDSSKCISKITGQPAHKTCKTEEQKEYLPEPFEPIFKPNQTEEREEKAEFNQTDIVEPVIEIDEDLLGVENIDFAEPKIEPKVVGVSSSFSS
jgi:hypothetical protein